MFNKKRFIVFIAFIILLFFLMTFGQGRGRGSLEATRNVLFTDSIGNVTISDQNVVVGTSAIVPKDPYHYNYIFRGWYLYKNRDVKVEDFSNILEDLHVIALYDDDFNHNNIPDDEEAHYTVRFITDGNGTLSGKSVYRNVLTGLTWAEAGITVPRTIANSGFRYTGWDKTFETVVERNVTYTALFAKTNARYTVNHHLQNLDKTYELDTVETLNGVIGESTNAQIKPYNGFHLREEIVQKTINSDDSTAVDIYYDRNDYNIVIDPDDGDIQGEDPSGYHPYGSKITLPTVTKSYTLTYSEADEVEEKQTSVTKTAELLGYCKNASVCLPADYIPAGTEVVVDDNAKYFAIWGTTEEITIETGNGYKTEDKVYTFDHWKNNGATVVTNTIKLDRDVTFVANYTSVTRQYKYTVNVYINNALDTTNDYEADFNSIVEADYYAPARTHLDFVSHTGDITISSNESLNVIDVYYKWHKYTVEVDPDGGTLENDPSGDHEYGSKIKLPTAKKSYTLTYEENALVNPKIDAVTKFAEFKGYCKGSSTCAASELIAAGAEVEVEIDVTYYAVWGTTEEITIVAGKGYQTESTVYTFKNWLNNGNVYTNSTIKLSQDETFTADYTDSVRQYTLTIHYVKAEGGKAFDDYVSNVGYNEAYSVDSQPLTGYTADQTTVSGTMTGDKEVTVTYTKNKYTLEIDYLYAKDNSIASPKYTQDYIYQEGYSVTSPPLTGYTADKPVVSGNMPAGNICITVKYTAIDVTVIIDPNGGTLPGQNPDENITNETQYNEEVTLPVPTRSYKLTYVENSLVNPKIGAVTKAAEFKGYCKDSLTCAASELITSDKVIATANATYYAVWGETENIVVAIGNGYETVERFYTFSHWTHNGNVYSNNTIKLSQDETLVAVYNEGALQKYNYTVKEFKDNNTVPFNTTSDTADYGSEILASDYISAPLHYKLDHVSANLITISENESANIIEIYYVKTNPNISVSVINDATDPSKYGEEVTYTITANNTGDEKGFVKLTDPLLMAAIEAGKIEVVSDQYGVLTSDGYLLEVEAGGAQTITLKVKVIAQAGDKIDSQINHTTYNGNPTDPTTEEISNGKVAPNVVDVEKNITITQFTEEIVGTNIAVVLDHSASMDGQKMINAKAATNSFVDNVFTQDYSGSSTITVIEFGTCKEVGVVDWTWEWDWGSWSYIKVPVYGCVEQGIYAKRLGSASNYQEAQTLKSKVNAIENKVYSSGTPYYVGLEEAYNTLTELAPNGNASALIFLSDGKPTQDNEALRNKYISDLSGMGTIKYSIGYDVKKGSTAHLVLNQVSGDPERTYLSGIGDLIAVFDDINENLQSSSTPTWTSEGVAQISSNIMVDADHPITITINGDEATAHKYYSIEDATGSGEIVQVDGIYKVDATKFEKSSTIAVSYYINSEAGNGNKSTTGSLSTRMTLGPAVDGSPEKSIFATDNVEQKETSVTSPAVDTLNDNSEDNSFENEALLEDEETTVLDTQVENSETETSEEVEETSKENPSNKDKKDSKLLVKPNEEELIKEEKKTEETLLDEETDAEALSE